MANVNPFQNPSPYPYPTQNGTGFGPPDTRGLPQGGPPSPGQFGPNIPFVPQGMPQGWPDTRGLPNAQFVPQGWPDTRGLPQGQFGPQVMPQGWPDTRGLPQGGPLSPGQFGSSGPFVPQGPQGWPGGQGQGFDTRGLPQGGPPSPGEPGNVSQQGAEGTPPGGPLPSVGGSPVGAQGMPTGAQGPTAAGPLSPEEKATLQRVLAILKEEREGIAKNQFSGMSGYRMLAACAYLSGFLEAKGIDEVGSFVKSIPSGQDGAGGNQDYDDLVQGVEGLLSGQQGTRGIGGFLKKVPWGKLAKHGAKIGASLFDD
jgi:hypothetical protein